MTLARAVWFGLQKSCSFLEMCGWSSGRTVINRDPTPEQSSQKIHGSITNYPVGQLSNRITHKAHHRQHWTNTEMYHGSDKELIWTHTVAHVLMFFHMFTDVALIGLVSPLGCRFRFRMLGLVAVVRQALVARVESIWKIMKVSSAFVCSTLLFFSFYISIYQLPAAIGCTISKPRRFSSCLVRPRPKAARRAATWETLKFSVSFCIRLP